MTAPHGTAPEYAQAQVDEWSRYVALVPIDFYGTRAYNPGDPVPVSAVEGDGAWISGDWVTARAADVRSQTAPPPEPPAIDPAVVAAPPGAAAAPPPEQPDGGGSQTTGNEG